MLQQIVQWQEHNTICHSRESGNPLHPLRSWSPAFAAL